MATRRPKPKPRAKPKQLPKGKWRKLKCPKCGHVIWRKPRLPDNTKCYQCGHNGTMVPDKGNG
jgi:predicted RNA-binding Zn-ribbon protein involved in translation (DUF1610 family)